MILPIILTFLLGTIVGYYFHYLIRQEYSKLEAYLITRHGIWVDLSDYNNSEIGGSLIQGIRQGWIEIKISANRLYARVILDKMPKNP